MLEMRASCERCEQALAPDGAAMICSYECTFCSACAAQMDDTCPNCSGVLLPRPPRVAPSAAG